jgi:hypothetical protein
MNCAEPYSFLFSNSSGDPLKTRNIVTFRPCSFSFP